MTAFMLILKASLKDVNELLEGKMKIVSKRKIVNLGKCLVVILPVAWVRLHRLTKDDMVEMEINRVITLRPVKRESNG